MWKDFFYFSKSQRRSISFMVVCILLAFVFNAILPFLFVAEPLPPLSEGFKKEIADFQKGLFAKDSLYRVKRMSFMKFHSFGSEEKPEEAYRLFQFDPNVADSAQLSALGLKPYVVSNILRYRAKGGSFSSLEGFSKVYGLSKEKFEELLPYIQIKQETKVEPESHLAINSNVSVVLVELNHADTTVLKSIRGIGSFLAKSIIRYRQQLGGFVDVKQLKEVYGMREESYLKLQNSFTVESNCVEKIKVNTASVERLNGHPYLNFYQAKSIYELRRSKGGLSELKDLYVLPDFTESEVKRIEPYLDFSR